MKLRRYHAAVWDEPLVLELGAPGRRGVVFGEAEAEIASVVGDPDALVPEGMRRVTPPVLPELSEPEVLRHYLHLSQETLGMMGVSLFGTCTMKYNPRLATELAARPEIAELHPDQDDVTLQGVLELVHGLDLILRGVSGMDAFAFQPGGGAHAAYTHAVITRAYHAARGELGRRDEIVTTIQAHPCNSATAAAAGFKIVTLPLEENGYPSLDALKAAVSERTASLMVGNPDDMGVYNPEIDKWVEVVHNAGGLCFYDHANFNGVMGKIKARELGFDACMYMLHKTFGAPKGGGGPAVGAYGCTEDLARYLPEPVVVREGNHYRLDRDRPDSVGKVREFWGNVPQIVYAYTWSRAMGAEGITQAADISVLANNYMETRLLALRGVTKSHPQLTAPRLEMTRYSLEAVERETGITVFDVQNRMVDFGIDAFWLSHEPWLVPQPFTPEAGEMWSKEDLDEWLDVLAHVIDEAYTNPEIVRTAPHNQAIRRLGATDLNDPAQWATTWRAHLRKRSAAAAVADPAGGDSAFSTLLAGRVALVTGGNRGLGAAIARTFARAGALGAAVDLAAGESPEGWSSLTADVTDEEAVERVVAATAERFGRLDVVVANAGVVPPWSDVSSLDLDALDRTLAVNVRGVAATMKHAARAMQASGGAIVVMASLNAWQAAPAQSAYTASKHAALGLVRTAALDLGRYGIRVNAIGPGPVATEALRERLARRAAEGGLAADEALDQAAAATALGRMVTEDDVARAALFLASDLSSGITGVLVPVDAGLR